MNEIFGVRSGWCASARLLVVLYAAVLTLGFQPRHLVVLVLGGAGVGLGLLCSAARLYRP